MTVLTCAIHGTAFNRACPGCNAADDWKIVGQVSERLRNSERCEKCSWVELEPDVSECPVCGALRFDAATMEQLERYLIGEPE